MVIMQIISFLAVIGAMVLIGCVAMAERRPAKAPTPIEMPPPPIPLPMSLSDRIARHNEMDDYLGYMAKVHQANRLAIETQIEIDQLTKP